MFNTCEGGNGIVTIAWFIISQNDERYAFALSVPPCISLISAVSCGEIRFAACPGNG